MVEKFEERWRKWRSRSIESIIVWSSTNRLLLANSIIFDDSKGRSTTQRNFNGRSVELEEEPFKLPKEESPTTKKLQWEKLNDPYACMEIIRELHGFIDMISALCRFDPGDIEDKVVQLKLARASLHNLTEFEEEKHSEIREVIGFAIDLGYYNVATKIVDDIRSKLKARAKPDDAEMIAELSELGATLSLHKEDFKNAKSEFRKCRKQYQFTEDQVRCAVLESVCKSIDRTTAPSIGRKCIRFFNKWLWGYTYSPWIFLFWTVVIWLLCALLYGVYGIHHGKEDLFLFASKLRCGVEQVSFWRVLWLDFYFSAVTFSTLGYGDYSPASLGSQVVAMVESILGGLVALPMFIFLLQRRYFSG